MGQAHGSKWKLRVLRKILSRRQGELSLGRWRRRREDGATSWRNGDQRSSAASEPIYPDPELGVLKTKLLRHKNWPGQEVVGDRGCDWLAEKKKCGTKTGRGGKPCVGCTGCQRPVGSGWQYYSIPRVRHYTGSTKNIRSRLAFTLLLIQ